MEAAVGRAEPVPSVAADGFAAAAVAGGDTPGAPPPAVSPAAEGFAAAVEAEAAKIARETGGG